MVRTCRMLSELRLSEFVGSVDFLRLDVIITPVGGFNGVNNSPGESSELEDLLENMAILSLTLFLLGSAVIPADLERVGGELVLLLQLLAPLLLFLY